MGCWSDRFPEILPEDFCPPFHCTCEEELSESWKAGFYADCGSQYPPQALLPTQERPEHTTGYEGFYHLIGIQGEVEQSSVSYIIRDHDRTKFENRKKEMERLVVQMNAEYGAGTVTLELRDQYYNMREKIEPVMHIIDTAFAAMEAVGVKPNVKPIRGGTDGAQLSFKGLPCPNIFAGGLNFHGRYEFVPIQNMEKAMKVIVKIAELVASK